MRNIKVLQEKILETENDYGNTYKILKVEIIRLESKITGIDEYD